MENDIERMERRNDPKVISIVAYLTLIGWVIAVAFLNNPKQEEASFHIRQALGVNLVFLASGIILIVPIIGWLAGVAGYMFGMIMWIVGFVAAVKGHDTHVPFLGEEFQDWFEAL